MNIDASLRAHLNHTFERHTPPREDDVVVGFYGNKLYLGIVELPDVDDAPEKGHLDVFWFRPHASYSKSTMFHPSLNPKGHRVCSFVKLRDVYSLKTQAYYFATEGVIRIKKTLPEILDGISGAGPASRKRVLHHPTDNAKRIKVDNLTSYPTTEKDGDSYKQCINDRLAELGRQTREMCHKMNPLCTTAALYLDAESARTSKTLHHNAGFRMEDMYCPNDSVDVAERIRSNTRHLPGRHPHTPVQTIEAFTANPPSGRLFSYAWIDGTCTWVGSGTHSTQEAVLKLFSNHMLASHSVVAYTASIRGMTGEQGRRARVDMLHNYKVIKRCAKQHGYTVECKPGIYHVPSVNSDMKNAGQIYTSYMRVWK